MIDHVIIHPENKAKYTAIKTTMQVIYKNRVNDMFDTTVLLLNF